MTSSKQEPDKKITWLVSYPKSGNTWMRMVVSAYCSDGVMDINRVWGTWGDLQEYAYQVVSPVPLGNLDHAGVLMLRPAALMHMIEQIQAKPTIFKTHTAHVELHGLPMIPWPLTKAALYIVRDPRDVVISYAEHFGLEIDRAIDGLLDADKGTLGNPGEPFHLISSWDLHVKSWLATRKPFRVAMVRYEDLLSDPTRYFDGALKALGIATTPERLRRAIEAASFINCQSQECVAGFKESSDRAEAFFARGTSGHWMETLTEEQAFRIERVCFDSMRELKYEPLVYEQGQREPPHGDEWNRLGCRESFRGEDFPEERNSLRQEAGADALVSGTD